MTQKQVSDQELINLYLSGQQVALEELLKRHKSKIYSSIYLMVKEKALAEDIFQDTFIKVIKTLRDGKYNEEGKFLPWVLRIAHNLVIDHFRREKRNPTVNNQSDDFDIFDTIKVYDESTEDRMLKEQAHSDLRKLIQELPEDQREVLIMRHFGDLSFKEIAEFTNVSINTALGRMRYALNNLRKLMEEKEQKLVRAS